MLTIEKELKAIRFQKERQLERLFQELKASKSMQESKEIIDDIYNLVHELI